MQNSPACTDPDFRYTDPKTGILRSLCGIADSGALQFAEAGLVVRRLHELRTKPVRITSSETLFSIHRCLFQDIYEWAGQRRTVEISKGGNPFLALSRFDTALSYIDDLLAAFRKADPDDKKRLSRSLAVILDAVNYLHPFREGNGRTQREFLRLLALEKGWKLSLNPPDDKSVYERYMEGTIFGDTDLLEALISECLDRAC